jgi:hypothetical protein
MSTNGRQCRLLDPTNVPLSVRKGISAKHGPESHWVDGERVQLNPVFKGFFKDDRSRLMGAHPGQYGYTIKTCALAAKRKNHKYFALQNGDGRTGWCTTSNDLGRGMSKGQSNRSRGFTGGPWVNAIFERSDTRHAFKFGEYGKTQYFTPAAPSDKLFERGEPNNGNDSENNLVLTNGKLKDLNGNARRPSLMQCIGPAP